MPPLALCQAASLVSLGRVALDWRAVRADSLQPQGMNRAHREENRLADRAPSFPVRTDAPRLDSCSSWTATHRHTT